MKTSSRREPFLVDDWLVDPLASRAVRCDVVHRLEPKVKAVLVLLAERAGTVVTRRELEETVWAGSVVGYDAVTNTVNKLRKLLGDDPRRPHIIETISKTGYCLIADVRPAATDTEQPGFEGAAQAERASIGSTGARHDVLPRRPAIASVRSRRRAWYLAGALAIGLAIALGWRHPWMAPTGAGVVGSAGGPTARPSVLVLPFEDLDGQSTPSYLADGITEDVITDLSRISGLSVASSRATAVSFERHALDVRSLGAALGVRYVLRGSVRSTTDRIRVTARLIETGGGIQQWSERFDLSHTDLLTLSDRIASRIVESLLVELSASERRVFTTLATHDAVAYDRFLRGKAAYWNWTPASNAEAIEHYRAAIERDPTFGLAFAQLSRAYISDSSTRRLRSCAPPCASIRTSSRPVASWPRCWWKSAASTRRAGRSGASWS